MRPDVRGEEIHPASRQASHSQAGTASPSCLGEEIHPAYLAPISHYSRLLRHGTMPREERWLNRCRILSPQGPLTLTIPLCRSTNDLRMSDHGNWRHLHWNALRTAYGNSPYFQFYEDDFAPFYEKRWDFLADLNEALHQLVCRLLGISPDCQGHAEAEAIACKPYTQVFTSVFQPDLSIVDLLFNMGSESALYL